MAEESRVKSDAPSMTSEGRVRNNAGQKKIAGALLADDVANAKSYIFWDVIIPTVKDAIGVTLHSAVDAIFGGGGRAAYGRQTYGSHSNHVNYSKISSTPASRSRDDDRVYDIYSFDDIEIKDPSVAYLIKDDLDEIIDEYGFCSVSDYFEVAKKYIRGLRIDTSPQDDRYGWTSLRAARVENIGRGMCYIRFPKVKPLK